MQQTVKALLFPREKAGERCYLFGQLPIMDAFMAWSNAGLACRQPAAAEAWRWKFQLLTALVVGMTGFLFWKWRVPLREA